MPNLDIVIANSTVVTPAGAQRLDIGIKDGRISVLASPGSALEAARTIDGTGRYALPGCVDCHVHTRDPGQTHKEDFNTLTRAAAAGGVTTIMCQPTTTPAINSADMVHQVAEDWPKKAMVDFTIQAMAEPGNIDEIPGMLEAGAVSMEFLGQGSTGPMMMDIMKAVHENGGISSMTASDGGHSQFMRQQLQESGRVDIRDWLEAWPRENESVGVARVLLLTENTPYRFHFHMITTKRSLELIREAKEKRPGSFTVETSPKYLLLTEEDHVRMGAFGTVLPRFKTPDDNAAVWGGLLDGSIDMVATDHAPHARAEKEEGFRDIWKAPTGVPEVEISLPLMLTQVNAGRLSLSQLAKVMSENPAREYGIYPQKGALQVGSDADLVLVDMERESTIDDGALVTAPKYSAFGGTPVKGMPVMTMVRGNVVMNEGEAAQGPSVGQLVKPRR